MKIKVEYTITLSEESMRDLTAYHLGVRPSQSDIRQILTDLGQLGLEELIFAGGETIKGREDAANA